MEKRTAWSDVKLPSSVQAATLTGRDSREEVSLGRRAPRTGLRISSSSVSKRKEAHHGSLCVMETGARADPKGCCEDKVG